MRSTLLKDLQTYNEVCTQLRDLAKTVKSTLLEDLVDTPVRMN